LAEPAHCRAEVARAGEGPDFPAQLPGGVSRIVRTGDGTLYVNADAGERTGVYQLRDCRTRLFAALPAGFVNGLALDGRTLYATDSSAGQVWPIPLDTGKRSC
jgi:hypothetical protein